MIRNIQALRVLAVYLVFLQHSIDTIALAGVNIDPLKFGRAGVDIFFVISGFIMVITTETRETRPLDFMRHRIVRIVPIYWLITVLLFAVTFITPHLFHAPPPAFKTLLKSLFFVPEMIDGRVRPILFVGWTLNYEMFFYLLFAFSLFIRQQTIRLASMISVLEILTIAGVLVPFRNVPAQFYTDPIMLEFGAGVLLGAWWSRMPTLNGLRRPLAVFAIAIGCALIVLESTFWPDIHRAISFGIPAVLIVGCALLLERSGWVVNAGWVLLLGNASYSIYLTHSFIAWIVEEVAMKRHFHAPALIGVSLLISLVAVTATGILTHWYVEKPMISFFKPRKAVA
jgi:exopolysaccharide production protein ExoZ